MSNSTKAQGRKVFEAHYSLVEELIAFYPVAIAWGRTNAGTLRRTPC